MIDRNHPAVTRCFPDGKVTDQHIIMAETFAEVIREARPHLTADDLRDTPGGRALMAEAWRKCQEHYAAEWDEWYPEDIFPSPSPPPAVVSRESVAAFMMRHWADRLRADPNPYREEIPND